MHRSRIRFVRLLLIQCAVSLVAVTTFPTVAAAAGVTRYVDCSAGNDANSGATAGSAWRSVVRANQASLAPGSWLLFKRGCTWSGNVLKARWFGTSTAPITIGAYGTGAKPLFQNAQDQLYITGSWLVVDGLAARSNPTTYDAQCQNQPAGRRSGFRVASGAANNVLRNLTATGLFFGIWIDVGAHHNKVLSNTLTNNNMKSDIWTSDAGAVGVAIHGDDNEIAWNTVTGSDACSRYYGRDGSAIDVWGGRRNVIHHNLAINNNTFTELGNARASDTTYAYNVVWATLPSSHFLTTRGVKDTKYGPIYRTKAYNNSVYLTGAQAYAVQCGHGCGPSVLSLRNNIIWSTWSIGYADAPFDEGDNIYWKAGGNPTVWFPMSATSRKADPRWAAPGSHDFHLQPTSPAINDASNHSLNLGFTRDYGRVPLPQGGAIDIGAHERIP